MEISRAATGLLVAACVTAGAAGTYLVVRGDAPDAPQAVEAAAPSTSAVVQSEGVLPEAAPLAEAPAPAGPLAPVAPAPRPARPARETKPAPPSRPALRVAANTPSPAPAPAREQTLATIPAPSIPESQSQPARPIEPPAPVLEELVVSAQSVIGLQMETAVSSETARLEDEVVARVTRDVKVGDRVAIPAGARAQGEVTLVERGGRVREPVRTRAPRAAVRGRPPGRRGVHDRRRDLRRGVRLGGRGRLPRGRQPRAADRRRRALRLAARGP